MKLKVIVHQPRRAVIGLKFLRFQAVLLKAKP